MLEENMLVVFVLNLKTVFPKQKQRPKINAPRWIGKASSKVPYYGMQACMHSLSLAVVEQRVSRSSKDNCSLSLAACKLALRGY